MRKRARIALLIACSVSGPAWMAGQKGQQPVYRADVDMVVLTFGVTDGKGNAIRGLKPAEIRISEDGIPQTIASFSEGSGPVEQFIDSTPEPGGTNVFILFDTSNRMYRTYPYVCDAVADFVRHLDPQDSLALYTFSRNLHRSVTLTKDHSAARAGLGDAVAGDDTALFNTLLLTLRDAAKIRGRKVVVVFSNGPDNASILGPDDVGRVAQDEGIPVYMISTQEAVKDPIFEAALNRLTDRTGGKHYQTRNWQEQAKAFSLVRDDIGSSYTVCYYPAPNPNESYRDIRIEIVRAAGTRYRIRARSGYEVPKRGRNGTN